MMRCLAELASGGWTPERTLLSEDLDRVAGMAEQALASGISAKSAVGVFFVPGRIEVLGKHTDYAGGRSLVVATEQGIWMLVCPREDRQLRVVDLGRGKDTRFDIGGQGETRCDDWSIYPKTVARRLDQTCSGGIRGAEILFTSTLVSAAGLSSSSALVVSTFMALSWCNNLGAHPDLSRELASKEDLAGFLGAVESGRAWGRLGGGAGVGTRGGDQDHTSILCSERGQIRQYRFLPTVCERTLAMPSSHIFAIAASGVRSRKTGAARNDYNRLSRLAARLENLWDSHSGGTPGTLDSIIRSAPENAKRLSSILESTVTDLEERRALQQRLEQFRQETEEIIPGAADALEQDDLSRFGEWVDRSMSLAAENLENQVEETLSLVSGARELGAVAASAFGAGFGGAVWALVPENGSSSFQERWSKNYLERFPEHRGAAQFLRTGAGGAATEL